MAIKLVTANVFISGKLALDVWNKCSMQHTQLFKINKANLVNSTRKEKKKWKQKKRKTVRTFITPILIPFRIKFKFHYTKEKKQ